MRLDQVLRYFQLFYVAISLQGNRNYLCAVDTDVIVFKFEHLQLLVLKKNRSQTASTIDAERVFSDAAFENAQVQGLDEGVFDHFFEDEGESDFADHVGGEVEI